MKTLLHASLFQSSRPILMVFLFFHLSSFRTQTFAYIDPIKFTIDTKATHVTVNEEFELIIRAVYQNIPANSIFVFEGSNSFRIKMVLPEGFEQTGGTLTDFVTGELSSAKPSVTYTLRGKFTKSTYSGMFELIRGHRNATSQSQFAMVAKLSFGVDDSQDSANNPISNERIMLEATQSAIPYLTIAQLRAGIDTSKTVFITDVGRSGLFMQNPLSTASDDGALVIIGSGRRYERVYNGPVNVTWFGAIGDGITDNTAIIQSILNRADIRNIHFPKPDMSYRLKEMHIRSNKNLSFEEGTIIEGLGTLAEQQRMVMMNGVQNITIRGNNVIFRDLKANYNSGQERHIFTLLGVTNVVIEGVAANNSGGDGFLIGSSVWQKYSENVKLINVSADNNRRQGLSIISGKNIEVINSSFTNTNGVAPGAGIDIEPDSPLEYLEGIRITNPRTINNQGYGIVILIDDFAGTDRIVDISIDNHIDDGGFYGMYISRATGPISGNITISNPIWKNNRASGFCASNYSSRACSVVLTNPTVINSNVSGYTDSVFGAAFLVYREYSVPSGDATIGNVHIIRPKVLDTRSTPKIISAIAFDDLSRVAPVKNVSVTDIEYIEGLKPDRYMYIANADLALSDRNKLLVYDLKNETRLLQFGFYKTLYHNASSTGLSIISLNALPVNHPEFTIEVRSPQNIRLVPVATNNILPLSSANGKYIQSSTVGSRLTLQKSLNNSWFIKEMIGTWTVQP